jgi:hypothetical protein
MRRAGFVAVAAALVLAMGLTGTAFAKPLRKSAYIKAADNVCGQANQLRDEVAATAFADVPAGGQPTIEQLTTYVTEIEPINDQQLDALRDLPAPKADKKKLKKIYKLVEKAFDALTADPSVLLTGPDVFAKADEAAQKYGFEVCGAESTD